MLLFICLGSRTPLILRITRPPPTIPSCPNHCGLSFSTGSYGSTLRRARGHILYLANSARQVSQSSSPSSTSSLLAATYLERSSTTGNGVSSFPFYLQSHVFLSFSPLLQVTGGTAPKQVSDAYCLCPRDSSSCCQSRQRERLGEACTSSKDRIKLSALLPQTAPHLTLRLKIISLEGSGHRKQSVALPSMKNMDSGTPSFH